MDLIFTLFQAYATAKDLAQVTDCVSDWIIDKVKRWSLKAKPEEIDHQIETIATATEEQIRRAAAKAFAKDTKSAVSEAEREEIISVLRTMARNVRYRTAFGSMSAGALRSERSLIELLGEAEPIRHCGESVTQGSPWVLRRHLGTGGFGEVWKAENPGFPIPRAYKFFTRDSSGEWLRRERNGLVAILKRIGDHRHIVELLDVQTECHHPYLALEYLGGGSLEEWIVKDKGRRPEIEPHEIVRQVVAGLSAAHAQGIAHRDIKPANILLTEGPDVRIKIGDFGLAKVAGPRREGASQLASLAGVVGTGLYLPPESQQRGVRRKSTQDDVFALGVVWYQLEVGAIERPPYDFAERLKAKGLDTHTIGLIERCLAHPDRRFADAREVENAMTDLLPPIVECPPGVPDVQHLAREYLSTLSR